MRGCRSCVCTHEKDIWCSQSDCKENTVQDLKENHYFLRVQVVSRKVQYKAFFFFKALLFLIIDGVFMLFDTACCFTGHFLMSPSDSFIRSHTEEAAARFQVRMKTNESSCPFSSSWSDLQAQHKNNLISRVGVKINVSVWWLAAVDSPLPASSFSFSTCLNHDLGEMNIMESTVTVIYFCSFTLCVIQLRVWCLALQLLSGPPLSISVSNPNVFQLSAFIRLEDWMLEVLTAVLPRWNCLGSSAMLFSPSLNSQKRDGYFREMRLSWAFELLLCSPAVVDSSDLTQTSSAKANILGYIFKENGGYLDFLLLWSTSSE